MAPADRRTRTQGNTEQGLDFRVLRAGRQDLKQPALSDVLARYACKDPLGVLPKLAQDGRGDFAECGIEFRRINRRIHDLTWAKFRTASNRAVTHNLGLSGP